MITTDQNENDLDDLTVIDPKEAKEAYEKHKKLVEEVAGAIVDAPRQRGKFHTVTAAGDPWWVACEVAKHFGPVVESRQPDGDSYRFGYTFSWEPGFAIQVLPARGEDWLFCFGW
uniref:Uncharacterized protein n=1 Tax=mine drainage metagenome TaxID=410659 RepID=E6PQ07_9ZZZZ